MSGLIIPAKNQSKVSILEGPGAYPDDDDDDDDDLGLMQKPEKPEVPLFLNFLEGTLVS